MLSHQLLIVDLVGRYPANYLISRTPIIKCRSFNINKMPYQIYYGVLIQISLGYSPLDGRLCTCSAPVCRSPSSIATHAAPRLACIKPAASVHPEPGSNSPL
eukprot:Amastigsp_a339273_899.p1 type:complete len:102 gc:universal Amastigsp_a339273_899:1085-1390(+)